MRVPGFARVAALALLALGSARASEAAEVTIGWDPPASGVIAGYVVYYGTTPHSYSQQVDVGAVTTYIVSGLSEGKTYYFAVRSYNAARTLSDFSEEISEAIPGTSPPVPAPPPVSAPPTSGATCVTPDPFAAIGGGVCYAGGWLPPGMLPPSGGTTVPPAPAPPAPNPIPPPSGSSHCSTPDPFAAMGGGSCYNGGWLPPGMLPPPTGPVTSAPAPAVTPATTGVPATQPAPPPPAASTCTTPDPFAAMGGGTCYNGGWLPPGMAVPGGSSAPTPPQPSTPSLPSTPGGCVTPDPFTAMGGGRCINGGWIPRSMGGGH